AGAGRRCVRRRDAVGHDPGRIVQDLGPARVQDVAAPPPLRARGLGRIPRGPALLYRRRAPRPALALDLQTPMTIDARHPLPGTRPLVVGAARSGVAAARLLVRLGADVRLADRRFGETGGAVLATQLREDGVAGS